MQQGEMDTTERYYLMIFRRLIKLGPIAAIPAGITFTAAWALGYYENLSLWQLLLFDAVCLCYFVSSYIMYRIGIVRNGRVDEKIVFKMEIALVCLLLLQWNIITYLFLNRAFWGCAPAFVLLSAFLFHPKIVLLEIGGISASLAVSWMLKGEELLPLRDGAFMESLILRVVVLLLSFALIYILTVCGNQFTRKVRQDYREKEEQNRRLENLSREIIDFSADMLEKRDGVSGSHSQRVKKYATVLGHRLAMLRPDYALTDEGIEKIALACVLHDIGKITIPDAILGKPGALTREEFDRMKTHTTAGAEMAEKLPDTIGSDVKELCRQVCLYHHEKADGRGYPEGLKGDQIPVAAQIASVVDCYDALTNERPYKKAIPPEEAVDMILRGECGAFTEEMKRCLTESAEELKKAA